MTTFTINSRSLSRTLNDLSKAISSKPSLQIHRNFLLEAADGHLTVTAADQETTAVRVLELSSQEGDTRILVDAAKLKQTVGKLPDCGLTFEITDGKLTIKTGKAKYSLVYYTDEFPRQTVSGEEPKSLPMPCEAFTAGINAVSYAVSTEPIRPMMTGVLLDVLEDKTVFVASDTHKLAKRAVDMTNPEQFRVIIPKKACDLITTLFKDNDLVVTTDTKTLLVTDGVSSVYTTLIKGNYPAYDRVIPSVEGAVKATVDSVDLKAALDRVGDYASKASGLVKFTLVPMVGMELEATDLDFDTAATESVPCEYDGIQARVGLNCTHVREILKPLSGRADIYILAENRPVLVTPSASTEGVSDISITMPLAIQD